MAISRTLRDAAFENVNDHGNDGLGHQALELPGQAAAHVGAEVNNAAAGHAAMITTAGTTISGWRVPRRCEMRILGM